MTKPEKNKWDLRFDKCSKAEPLSTEDKVALAKLMDNTGFVRLMGELLRESDNLVTRLGQMPLTDPAKVWEASVMQGQAKGLAAAVLMALNLMSEVDEIEKPEGEKPNG